MSVLCQIDALSIALVERQLFGVWFASRRPPKALIKSHDKVIECHSNDSDCCLDIRKQSPNRGHTIDCGQHWAQRSVQHSEHNLISGPVHRNCHFFWLALMFETIISKTLIISVVVECVLYLCDGVVWEPPTAPKLPTERRKAFQEKGLFRARLYCVINAIQPILIFLMFLILFWLMTRFCASKRNSFRTSFNANYINANKALSAHSVLTQCSAGAQPALTPGSQCSALNRSVTRLWLRWLRWRHNWWSLLTIFIYITRIILHLHWIRIIC